MDYIAALPLGLFLGMAHALEADHLAAVTALHDRRDTTSAIVRRGIVWGVGHTLSLSMVCMGVFLFGLTISGPLEAALEFLVGLMIAVLGLYVLWRLCRDRIHLHVHDHDGDRHIHVHSHAGESTAHSDSRHRHAGGSAAGTSKVMAVGAMHGLAGSAGFLVLMTASADDVWQALAYLAVFGSGSIMGMAVFSAVVSLPLGLVQRIGGWFPAATTGAIGIAATVVGGMLAFESIGAFYAGGG